MRQKFLFRYGTEGGGADVLIDEEGKVTEKGSSGGIEPGDGNTWEKQYDSWELFWTQFTLQKHWPCFHPLYIHPVLRPFMKGYLFFKTKYLETIPSWQEYHEQSWNAAVYGLMDREQPEEDSTVVFEFTIGGYMGSSTTYFFRSGLLSVSKSEYVVLVNKEPATIFPVCNNTHWQAVLDYLQSRRWKKEYINPYVCDGTFWDLSFQSNKTNIESSGSNKYPKGFLTFLNLLNKLTKGYCATV